MLNENQIKFVQLVKQFELLKNQMDDVREQLNQAMLDLGMNSYTQDPDTLAVYKVVEPKGRFVHFPRIDFVRTALGSERAGSLSKTEAEANGFQLKK